jgi:hypothetical protein
MNTTQENTMQTLATFENSTLTTDGEYFIMEGPSGRHTLACDCTDEKRLAAHWRGFSGQHTDAALTTKVRKGERLHIVRHADGTETTRQSRATYAAAVVYTYTVTEEAIAERVAHYNALIAKFQAKLDASTDPIAVAYNRQGVHGAEAALARYTAASRPGVYHGVCSWHSTAKLAQAKIGTAHNRMERNLVDGADLVVSIVRLDPVTHAAIR